MLNALYSFSHLDFTTTIWRSITLFYKVQQWRRHTFNTNVPNFKTHHFVTMCHFHCGVFKTTFFFLSSDSSTQCSSCSSPPRAQVFLHRHPSFQARGEGMTGHHVAKTLKQPMKTKLWEEQPASHKHPAILCQPCVQATWDLGPPAPGQPSEGCNLLKDPEPWQLSYATLEYLMCRNYKDTKCLFFKVC